MQLMQKIILDTKAAGSSQNGQWLAVFCLRQEGFVSDLVDFSLYLLEGGGGGSSLLSLLLRARTIFASFGALFRDRPV